MADEPRSLGVYFEARKVGTVAVDGSGRFVFEYADSWVTGPNPFAISHSLPLEGSDAEEEAGHAFFFSNLLPEGRVRELVAKRLGGPSNC
jgi:HipA-like protein